MKRSILRNLALAATVTTVSVACGDESSGLDFGAAGGQTQGLVTGSATQLSTVSVGEGTGMSVVTNSLCVNSNTQAVRAIVDWGDVNDTADSVLTITPGADVVLDGNIVAAATAFTAGGGCAAGEFQVCGGNPDNCANIPHTYADDTEGATTTVNVLYEQPALDTTFSAPFLPGQGNSGQNTQARTITVNNLPPTVPTANRSGVTNEGTNQTLQIQLADAGTRPGELVSATVSFGDADPTTINCTCAASGASDTLTCRNPSASNVVVATASPCTSLFTLESFLLDNQNYQLRIEVLDEDGNPAAPVVRIVDVAMANVAPTPSIAIVNDDTDTAGGTAPLAALATSTTVSTVVGTPTTVLEGFDYRFTFSFTDPGTDLLNWSWNLAGRDTGGTNASPTATSHLGRMVFSRSPTPGTTLSAGLAGTVPVPLLNNTQRVVSFDQGTPQTLNVIATDDDAAVANSAHFINVVDVDPRVTSFTSDKATAVEGEAVIFTVNAISGDFGSGLDVISTTGYVWEIEVDGTFVAATNFAALAGRVSITDGCNGTGTTTDGGRTGTDTCTLTFLDADVGFTSNQYRVRVTVSDEDSNDIEVSSAVTVTNDIPAITKLNVTRGATTIGSLSSIPPLAGTINEADTISVTVGFDDDAAARDGTYTLAIDYGQTTPTNDSATLAAPGDFTAQSETFADNKACTAGVCTITVTVCEAAPVLPALPACDTETFALTVSNVAPTATATGPTGTLVEGATFTFDGSFTDPALAADELYQVEWTWIDGTTPRSVSASPNSTFADRNTSPDIAGTPFSNIAAGASVAVSLTLTVTDADGASDTDTINVTVRDSSPTVSIKTATLRNRFDTTATDARENVAVGRITLDANPETNSDLLNTITVNWGDGTQTVLTGSAAPALPNEFLNTGVTDLVVVKDTPYTDNCTGASCVGGAYPVTVTVNDEDSATPSTPTGHVACSGTQPFATTCQRATLAVSNEVPVVVESTPADGGTIIVAEGQAATIVVVADDLASPDVIGANANMNFVFDWDSRTTGQVDTTVDTIAGTQTARANVISTPPGSIDDGQVRVGRGAHIYSSPGQFPVTVTVTDKDGGNSVQLTFTVDVINVAPVLDDLFVTTPVNEGIAASVLAVVDNRGADTLRYTFSTTVDATACNPAVGGVTDADFATPRPGTGTTAVFGATFPDNNASRNICVRVCDDDGQGNSCVFGSASVAVRNVDPVITAFSASATSINEGGSVTFSGTATDVAADPLTGVIACGNNTTAPVLSGVCTYVQSGAFIATVTFTEKDGGVASRAIPILVNNVAPTLTAPAAPAAIDAGADVTLSFTGNDPGGDRIYFLLSNGLSTQSVASGASATITLQGIRATTNFAVRACDEEGLCSDPAQTVTVTVNNGAPVISSLVAPSLVRRGQPFTLVASATDPNNTALTYRFSLTNLGGNAPRGVAANPVTGGTPPGSANAVTVTINEAGRITALVEVSDGSVTTTATTLIDVEDVPGRITSFTSAPVDRVNEGGSVVLTVGADEPLTTADAFTFTFDCDGNGTFETPDSDFIQATGTATCTFPRSGAFLPGVRAVDSSGNIDTSSLTIAVDNVAPTLGLIGSTTVNEGTATTLTVTGSADVGGDAIRIEYDTNGDGAFDLVSDAANGSAQALFRDGNTTIRARACDVEGACSASASATATVLVNNAAPVIQQVSAPSTAIAGAPVAVNVTATDAGNDALTYTFVIRRGDQLFQTIGPQSSPFFTSTFSDSGSYTVDITVTDTANAPATVATDTESVAFLITDLTTNLVASANPSVLSEGGTTTITVTPTNGVGPYIVSYDLNADGDFNDAGVDVADQSCNATTTPCRVTTTYRQNRAGNISSRVLVSVTDTGNNDAINTAIVAIEVRNVAPTLNAGADANLVEQALFTRSLGGAQTDPGVEDTFTFSLVSGPPSMTVSPAGVISWRPTYTDAGLNTIVVRVTDSDGASGDDTFSIAVSIIDTNGNGVSDTQERERNNGDLLPPGAEETDTDNDGVSDLDEVLDGTDPTESDAPRAPVVISPNGVTVDTATPTLVVANAFSPRGLDLTYTFVVLDGDGDEVVRIEDVEEGESTTSAAVPAAALGEQEKYTWFAFAKDGLRNLDDTADIEGESSDEGSFTVDALNSAPGAPAPVSPANGSSFLEGTLVNLETRAVVDADGDAVTYVFQVARDAAFTQIVATSEPRPVPFFALPTALDVGNYFWRATASDGVLTSAPGATGTFSITATETNAAPGEPTIVSPANETLAATTAALTITTGTDADGDTLTYEFELADNAAFAGAETSGLQAGLVFNVTGLGEDTQYFWRARSFDGALYSDWVSATFVVDAQNGAPTGLAILSPSDGALLLVAPTAFSATEASDPEGDALTYTVVVSANADFSSPIVEAEAAVVDGTVRLAAPADLAGSLVAGSTYYWKVTATDGTSEVAAAASFSLYKAVEIPEPTPPPEGGCNCSADSTNDAMGVMVAGLGLLGLRRRRRR
jgi:MYXO-CTERM domain-containing protein